MLIIQLPSKILFSKMLAICCACCIAWLLEYGLIWLGKWGLASIVLGGNIISYVFGRVAFRVGVSGKGRAYSSNTEIFALGLNVLKLRKVMWLLFLEAAVVLISLVIVIALRKRGYEAIALIKRLGLLATVCLLPYIWYTLAANHKI